MRSGLSKVDFFLKCKRKPAQQDLLDRIETLSQEDIETCGQPLWVREALTELKKRGGKSQSQSIEAIADRMQANTPQVAAPTHDIFKWTGPEVDIKPQRGMGITLMHGDIYLYDAQTSEVKIDYNIIQVNHATIQMLLGNSTYMAHLTDREYIEFVSQNKG